MVPSNLAYSVILWKKNPHEKPLFKMVSVHTLLIWKMKFVNEAIYKLPQRGILYCNIKLLFSTLGIQNSLLTSLQKMLLPTGECTQVLLSLVELYPRHTLVQQNFVSKMIISTLLIAPKIPLIWYLKDN